jgi:hypothetical protein
MQTNIFVQQILNCCSLIAKLIFAILILGSPASARPYHPATEVGVRCQQEYQNNWQTDVGNSDEATLQQFH